MAKTFKPVLPLRAGLEVTPPEFDFLALLNEPVASLPPVRTTQELSTETPRGDQENKLIPFPGDASGTRGVTGNISTLRKPAPPRNSSLDPQSQPAGKRRTPSNTVAVTTKKLPTTAGSPSHTPEPIPRDFSAAARARSVRQTFVVSSYHLSYLRDYVHARRVSGEYSFSQKEALELALDWLFAQGPPVMPRPPQVREREQRQGDLIRKGRQLSQSK